MPAAAPIPEGFLAGPFHRREFVAAGMSPKLLLGRRFRRVFPSVWSPARDLTHAEWIRAAALSLTDRAWLSHLTRLQALGLDEPPYRPLHFTVQGDLHIDTDGIFLHRTVDLPPLDDVGVTPAAAFIQCCAAGRLIDLVKIGDWLLHHEHVSVIEVHELVAAQPWRPGAEEALTVLPMLDGRARSPKESELRCLVVACGLPQPEVNVPIVDDTGRQIAIVDLLLPEWLFVLEYEGRQHAEDARQFAIDIDRYAELRRVDAAYMQFTARHLASPRAAMTQLHRRLVARGYSGPPPEFGAAWHALFAPVEVPRGAVR